LGAAWLVFGALVVGIGLIGPFILVAGPVVLFSGAAVLGYLHGRAGEDPACSECGKLDRPGAPENSALESLSAAGDMCDAAA
jgi:hypothetical protein